MACLLPASAGSHSSDMQLAVSQLQQNNYLMGYRNLLSYATSLGVPVLRRSALSQEEWRLRSQGQYSAAYEAVLAGALAVEKVIIKRPKASFSRDSANIESELQHKALSGIIQELRILAHQDLRAHTNLPRILGVFFEEVLNPDGTIPCLVFEQAISDLFSYLGDNPSGIPATTIRSFSSDIAAGLSAIHGHGLVHGDLKPSNILLFLRDGRLAAALADFSTCGIADQSPRHVGIIPGTAGFWAPEYYRESAYHAWVNSPPRDIYGFGLVVVSMMGHSQTPPFPDSSMTLQHDDQRCLDHLRGRVPVLLPDGDFLWWVVEHCVVANPEKRWSLGRLGSELRSIQGLDDSLFHQVQAHAEQALLKDPDNPRVTILHQMELSSHLHSKLVSEYVMAVKESVDVRLAVTLAALYSGALGPAVESPYNFVAKTQWLLKAIELGSLPAVHALFEDRNTLRIVETIGRPLMSYKPLTFHAPYISTEALLERLHTFATQLSDVDSLNLLVFLGGGIPETFGLGNPSFKPRSSMQEKLREDFPGLYDLEDLKLNVLELDLQILDADAYDLVFSQKELFVLAYNDDLEAMMRQPDAAIVPYLHELLHTAVFGGSVRTVRYLVSSYDMDPNAIISDDSVMAPREPNMATSPTSQDEPEAEERSGSDCTDSDVSDDVLDMDMDGASYGLSFLDFAIILGRRAVVIALLERGARIHGAAAARPSSLHYLARFDDSELAKAVCQSLPDRQRFQEIMESKPSQGKLEGISAIELNMSAGRWRNVLQMIRQSETLDTSLGESNLLYLAISRSPPAPLFIIEEMLARGVDPDVAADATRPPLCWTIGSSNVAATEMLLRYGANLRPSGDVDLVGFAKECLDEIDTYYSNVIVVNKEGVLCPEGLRTVKQAAATVYVMATIAAEAGNHWLRDLGVCMSQCPDDCLGKIWLANSSEPKETTMLLELPIPT
ncbi:kinase-like protein [Canariomyces notabilis]|uniref:Kinase-like protein n=1 Tax=Canariomyces notabilis TaxID=2074819 RepID=A0AAN6TEF0_9PEZI|nr:kinase-like protein [Canariomyces arenarius]